VSADVFASVRAPDAARPWPAQPLIDAIDPEGEFGKARVARLLRCSWNALDRALNEGCTGDQADRWAITAGFHPSEVWGWQWFDHVLREGSRRRCELDTCDVEFTPRRKEQRYCSDRHRLTAGQRAYMARKRAAESEGTAA
jgi:hypothetical protein